jgi:hypothetical protein
VAFLDTHELAWAAGFVDGEGWMGFSGHSPRLSVTQVDRRVLDRLQAALLGLGRVAGPYDKATEERPNIQPQWIYRAQSWHEVQAAIALMWKYLSPVKRAQARRTLLALREYQQSTKRQLRDAWVVDALCGRVEVPE